MNLGPAPRALYAHKGTHEHFQFMNEVVEVFTPYYNDRRTMSVIVWTSRKGILEEGKHFLEFLRENLMTSH